MYDTSKEQLDWDSKHTDVTVTLHTMEISQTLEGPMGWADILMRLEHKLNWALQNTQNKNYHAKAMLYQSELQYSQPLSFLMSLFKEIYQCQEGCLLVYVPIRKVGGNNLETEG